MSKQSTYTDKAPTPFGAYSQAVKAPTGQTVYLAGQIPFCVKAGKVVKDSVEQQTELCFENLKAVAEASGGKMDDIVKVNIFITDFKDFPTINTVMAKYFNKPYPARSTVGVASLGMGVDVEIEAIMVIPDKK